MLRPSFTIRWQRWTIYATVASTTLAMWTGAADSFGLPKATMLWLGALVLLALTAVRVGEEGTVAIPRTPLAAALAAFAVALVAATITSPTTALSIVGESSRYTGLLSYLAAVVVALVVLRIFDVDELATFLRLLTGLTVVVGAYALLQYLDADPISWESHGFTDIVGTLGNSNLLAGWLGVATPAAAWVALSGTTDRRWRIAGAAVLVLALAAVVASGSFQGPVAAFAGLVVLLVVWMTTSDGRAVVARRAKRRPLLVGLAVVAVAALVAAPFAVRATVHGVDTGLDERASFWHAAVSMWSDGPVLGRGLDTYGQHFLAVRPSHDAITQRSTVAESAHSVPLNLLAGGGIVLFLSWLAIIVATGWALVRGLRRLAGEERLLLGALGACWVAYLVQSSVSFDVPELSVLHAVLAGGIVAIGTPPHFASLRLPWARTPGRRGQLPPLPIAGRAVQVVGVVGALVLAWFAIRPLRADHSVANAAASVRSGDIDGAADELRRATDLVPWRGRYWLVQTQVAERRQEVFASIDFAEQAARREPGSAEYALLAAELTERYRSAAEAEQLYEEALRRDPHNPNVQAAVARGLATVQPERAVELAEGVLQIDPERVDAWLALGTVHQARGETRDAINAFRQARSLDPSSRQANEALATLQPTEEGTDG